jgi:F-box interacting protein
MDLCSNPAANLTDDLIIEILSLLPAKSLCRFKCVSRHWRGLISDPAHRKRFPQTLSGFFFNRIGHSGVAPSFAGFSGNQQDQPFSDPALSFSRGYKHTVLKDHCNGLLLCNCSHEYPPEEFDRVVYNPATEKWRVVPGYMDRKVPVHLCFDPAVSSHFHLVALLQEDRVGCITGLEIYSSQTGEWSQRETGWDDETQKIASASGSVFLNGMLNLVTDDPAVVAVDMEGKTWRTIPIRSLRNVVAEIFAFGSDDFISQTQGRLCYVSYTRKRYPSNLSVWILEDYCRGEWVFKYSITPCSSQLSTKKDFIFQDYNVIALHPECSLVFLFLKSENALVSYDKDRGEVCVIRNLEYDFCGPYLPYVPLFSESPADQN